MTQGWRLSCPTRARFTETLSGWERKTISPLTPAPCPLCPLRACGGRCREHLWGEEG